MIKWSTSGKNLKNFFVKQKPNNNQSILVKHMIKLELLPHSAQVAAEFMYWLIQCLATWFKTNHQELNINKLKEFLVDYSTAEKLQILKHGFFHTCSTQEHRRATPGWVVSYSKVELFVVVNKNCWKFFFFCLTDNPLGILTSILTCYSPECLCVSLYIECQSLIKLTKVPRGPGEPISPVNPNGPCQRSSKLNHSTVKSPSILHAKWNRKTYCRASTTSWASWTLIPLYRGK